MPADIWLEQPHERAQGYHLLMTIHSTINIRYKTRGYNKIWLCAQFEVLEISRHLQGFIIRKRI
jgi:hypothetical protein